MANEKWLIDAVRLVIKLSKKVRFGRIEYDDLLAVIADAPTVDAVEVVHGRWIMGVDEGDYEYGTCSMCGYNEYNAFCCLLPHNYCPNCGAKMDGDGNG